MRLNWRFQYLYNSKSLFLVIRRKKNPKLKKKKLYFSILGDPEPCLNETDPNQDETNPQHWILRRKLLLRIEQNLFKSRILKTLFTRGCFGWNLFMKEKLAIINRQFSFNNMFYFNKFYMVKSILPHHGGLVFALYS